MSPDNCRLYKSVADLNERYSDACGIQFSEYTFHRINFALDTLFFYYHREEDEHEYRGEEEDVNGLYQEVCALLLQHQCIDKVDVRCAYPQDLPQVLESTLHAMWWIKHAGLQPGVFTQRDGVSSWKDLQSVTFADHGDFVFPQPAHQLFSPLSRSVTQQLVCLSSVQDHNLPLPHRLTFQCKYIECEYLPLLFARSEFPNLQCANFNLCTCSLESVCAGLCSFLRKCDKLRKFSLRLLGEQCSTQTVVVLVAAAAAVGVCEISITDGAGRNLFDASTKQDFLKIFNNHKYEVLHLEPVHRELLQLISDHSSDKRPPPNVIGLGLTLQGVAPAAQYECEYRDTSSIVRLKFNDAPLNLVPDLDFKHVQRLEVVAVSNGEDDNGDVNLTERVSRAISDPLCQIKELSTKGLRATKLLILALASNGSLTRVTIADAHDEVSESAVLQFLTENTTLDALHLNNSVPLAQAVAKHIAVNQTLHCVSAVGAGKKCELLLNRWSQSKAASVFRAAEAVLECDLSLPSLLLIDSVKKDRLANVLLEMGVPKHRLCAMKAYISRNFFSLDENVRGSFIFMNNLAIQCAIVRFLKLGYFYKKID